MQIPEENAKTLKNIELNASVAAEFLEHLPGIKTELQTAQVEVKAAVASLRGLLQAILAALIVIAVILLMK